MRRCPECNNLVDESLKECNFCGYPFCGSEKEIELNDNVYKGKDIEISNEEACKEEKQDAKLEDSDKEKEKDIPEKQEELTNEKEESEIFSLIDTDFRNDLSTAKQYMAGKFGSFPKVNLNFLRDGWED